MASDVWGIPEDETAADWRAKLFETIDAVAHLPNLLSGGVDSATLLAAQYALGHRPTCYSFNLGGEPNPDWSTARRMASDLGLEFETVEIPTSYPDLRTDVYRLVRLTQRSRKTIIQCSHPFLYLAPRIRDDGWTGAIVGTGAVCLDDRKVHTIWSQEGETAAREYRRLKLDDRYLDVGTGHMHRTARLFGVRLEEPYSDEPLRSFALALDYAELNRPRQKGIAIRAFPDFWNRPDYYRRNSPLQVASGIRELHDSLLDSPMNVRGSRAVVAIYNDVQKEIASYV